MEAFESDSESGKFGFIIENIIVFKKSIMCQDFHKKFLYYILECENSDDEEGEAFTPGNIKYLSIFLQEYISCQEDLYGQEA